MFSPYKYEEFNEDLKTIRKTIKYAEKLHNSIADNRNEHRKFAENIDLEYAVLEKAYNLYEPNLLISVYTFAEKLLKKFIYIALCIDESVYENNGYNSERIRNFIKNTIPEKRFVPKTKLQDIKETFKKDICINYKIGFNILNLNMDYFKSYDNMIDHRHKYAHTGNNKGFDLNLIKDATDVVEFLYEEIYNITNHSKSTENFYENIYLMLDKINDIYKQKDKYRRNNELKDKITEIKKYSKNIIPLFKELKTNSVVYKSINDFIDKVNTGDEDDLLCIINDFKIFDISKIKN